MSALPDRPSELIRLGLRDLRRTEADGDYEVEMGIWHAREEEDGPCLVCLAGAVMAQTLGAAQGDNLVPSDFSGPDDRRLRALDLLRQGEVRLALTDLGLARPAAIPASIAITQYHRSPEDFRSDLEELAKALEENGL